MEDLEKYLKILNSERCLKKPKEAAVVLDMISECFSQEKSQFTIGLFISLVLDENDSIFTFIWKTCGEFETVPSVLSAFKLLNYLVTTFQKCGEPYFPILFKKCLYLLDTNFAKIKESSLKLIRNMIEAYSRNSLDASELVSKLEKILREDAKIPKSVSEQIFSLLGYLFLKFPESVTNEQWFFRKIFKSLRDESAAAKPSVGSVKGAFEGINGYLTNYAVPDAETLRKTYGYIKSWSKLREDRKVASRAALNVLQSHWKHFATLIYDDKEFWRINAEVWIKEKNSDRQSAFKFLCAFYSVIAFFVKQNSNVAELNGYVKEFTSTLESNGNFYEKKGALVGLRLFVLTDSLRGDRFNDSYERLVKFIKSEEASKNSLCMPLCVECVSAFALKFTDESFFMDQLSFLQRLSVRLIENYASFDAELQRNAEIALEKSFYMLGLSSLDVMKNHIDRVVYQGLIRTCSAGTLSEAELLRETGQSPNPVSYKSYLSLWKYLLTLASTPTLPIVGSFTLKKGVAVNVFDAFIASFLKIVSKLNFGLGSEMEVEKPSDLHILINIVDLYQDVIPSTDVFNLQKWWIDIFRIVTYLSNKNPLVSGFYTIIAVSFKIAESIQFFEDWTKEKDKCFELVENFLDNVLVKIDRYKGDLQMACFRVLLAAPVVLIENFAEKVVPALEVIARFARSSFPLLKELVEALERWDSSLPPETSGVIVEKILPYFDIFFQSSYFRGKDSVAYSKEGKKLKMEAVFNDSELLTLQKRFLLFLGHMEVRRGVRLIELPDAEERRKISDKQLVYTLPYNKGWVEMNLEEMIPRIVNLAESCSDRKTRITACELLHSVVMLILGNINQLSGGYTYLFRKVMRSCLMLGCDADGLVCQIFEPLMFQVTHYFSGKQALHLTETSDLIDMLLEYVTCQYNPTVRDFAAVLLREFTLWSFKQTTPEQLKVTPESVKTILQRIYSLALHPSYSKRLGAAVVFNKIYSILREEEFILNVYWFQLVYYFVECLRMCDGSEDVTEITEAIDHLMRPLIEKHEEFNKESPERIVPPEFEGGRLCHLVKWTMELAIDDKTTTRHVAVNLFEKLAPYVMYCDSKIHFVSKQLQDFLFSFETKELFCEESFVRWLKNQTAGFEYCTWLLRQNVLTAGEVLQPAFTEVLKRYITHIMEHRDKQSVDLDKHKQESVLAVLLVLYGLRERAYLFPQKLWTFLQTVVFRPSEFGFDLYDARTTDRLLSVLADLLNHMAFNLPAYDMSKFYENVEGVITLPRFSQITRSKHVTVENVEFLFSLRVAEAADIWTPFTSRVYFCRVEEHFVFPIFRSLFFSEGKTVYAVALESFCKFYLEEVLRILLKTSIDLKVLKFLENQEEVIEEETGKPVKKGEFFQFVFKKVIFEFLEDKHDLLVDWALTQEGVKGVQLLVQVLENQSENRKLPEQILHRWEEFERVRIKDEGLKDKALLRLIVCGARVVGTPGFLKKSTVADKIYAVLENLKFYEMDYSEVESIFSLLPFLSEFEEGLDGNDKLRDCLFKIQIESNASKSEEVVVLSFALKESLGPSKFNRVHVAFGELLKSLKLTGSLVVLDFVLSRSQWISSVCKKEDVESCLSVFAEDRTSLAHALSAAELVYAHCFDEQTPCFPTLVYELFLDPLLKMLPASIVSQLVDKNLERLRDLILSHWGEEKRLNKISKNLLSRICASKLLQRFFTRITKEELAEMPIERRQVIDGIIKKVTSVLKQPQPPIVLKKYYRKLICQFFNMICCIISMRCVDEKFYKLFIFDERGGFLFEAVDKSVTYNLAMDFDEIPRRKKHLTMLREAVTREKQTGPVRYIHTNTLFTSSLQEDVTRFDLTSSLIRPTSAFPPPSKNVEIELEMDSLNSHECMATLVATVSKMVQDKIPPMDGATGLPCWLKFFLNVVKNPELHENLRLFVFKAIYNVQGFVGPFAKGIFSELLSAILKLFTDLPINYFLFDLVEMMMGWRHVPEDEKSQAELTTLVLLMMDKSDSFRRDIISANLEILKTIIEVWKGGMILPRLSEHVFKRLCQSVAEDLKSDTSADSASYLNIQVCGILLSNGIPAWKEGCEERFFDIILGNFRSKNKHNRLFGEVCGQALNHIEKSKPEILEEFEKHAWERISCQADCWLQILYAVYKHHPKISSLFTFRILSSAWDSTDSLTVKKLEMLVGQATDPAFERHGFSFITDMLNSPDVAVQEVTLQIAGKLVEKFDVEKLKKVMKEVLRLQKSAHPGVRKQVYEISKKLYVTGRSEVIRLACRVILVRGLCDDVKELEESCLAFWKTVFTSTDIALLHVVREMYTPETEDIFLSNTARILLHLAGEDHNSQKNVFPHPITLQCRFRKRNLILGTRQSFLLSLASSGRTLANQSLENLATIARQNASYVRPTPSSLMFQPTVQENGGDAVPEVGAPRETLVDADGFVVPKNPLKRRFHKKEGKSYFSYATKKRTDAEDVQRKEAEMEVYGEYRDGDYPDIQISHSQIVKLLEVLAMRDPQIARVFLVSFYSGLIKTVTNEERESLLCMTAKCFENMLRSSENYDPGVFGFVLQVILNHNESLSIDWHLISNAAFSSNWISLGALILEQVLTRKEEDAEEGSPKRPRGCEDPEEKTWLNLAKLYRGMEEFDVLSGIFLDKLTVSPDAKEAIRCETVGDWQDALQHYVTVLQSNSDSSEKEFYTESYLSCLAKLSSWSALNKCIRATVNDDLGKLWENYYLLSWFVKSEMMVSLGGEGSEFRATFEDFFKSPAKRKALSTNFGEEMTVFDWFCGNFQRANYRIDKLCLDFLAGWSHLDPWSYNLRAAKLARLQTLSELSFAAKNLAEVNRSELEQNIQLGEKRWRKNVPAPGDDLTIWDVKLGYRREFIKRLQDFDLTRANVKSNLALARAALAQSNLNMTKECLCRVKEKLPVGDFDLETEYHICFNLGKMVVAKAKLKEPNVGLKVYLKVWSEISEQISAAMETKSSNILLFSFNFLLGQLVSEILPYVENQTASPEIIDLIGGRLNSGNDVAAGLKRQGLDYFEKASRALECEDSSPETKSNTYLEIAKFLLKFPDRENFVKLCEILLRSMALGNAEARELFGCLLNMSHALPDGASCEELIAHGNLVPSWMFLPWINQMFACLNSKLYPFLCSVLLNLAQDYPNAIRHSAKVMEAGKSEDPGTKSFFVKLRAALPKDVLFDNFWDSMRYVAQPHMILKHVLEEVLDEATQPEPDSLRIQKILLDLKELMFSEDLKLFRGPIFQFWLKFKEPVQKLLTIFNDPETLKRETKDLLASIENSKMPRKRVLALLMSYSPWLHNFQALKANGALELPGQYDGSRPPTKPVTVYSFRNDVLLFDTKCRPMRISILGNDAKEHKFLVKFGEDLRQDERIQRVFQHFNHRLSESRHAGRFRVDTYKVVPLTPSLGMIEWVENNVSLFEMLENSLGDDSDAIAKAQAAQLSFLGQALTAPGWGPVDAHLSAYRSIERHKAVSGFRTRVQEFPRDLLRRCFLDLSTSPQHFIHLRGNFATSHAVMCVTHWLIGIGDRHLQNTLVSTKTGRVLGIDFGYAFGFATQFLTPPELLPFRLTPQILNFMRPLGESGWIKQTMIRCLRVFRKESFRLRAVLEVFAEEPVMDWLKQARKNPNRNAENIEGWYPREKLSLVECKLNGANPVKPFESDLRAGHSQSEHLERFLEVLRGVPQDNIRARCGEGGLSEEEQVECLIDLATDAHVLAKTYIGWNPWL